MSAAVEEAVMTPRESAEFYIPLVKEYADKLTALCQQANTVRFNLSLAGGRGIPVLTAEAARLVELYERLSPIIKTLLVRTSTLLDLANLGRDYDLALALGQEELEASFRFAPFVFSDLEAAFGTKQIREIIDKSRVKVIG